MKKSIMEDYLLLCSVLLIILMNPVNTCRLFSSCSTFYYFRKTNGKKDKIIMFRDDIMKIMLWTFYVKRKWTKKFRVV